MIWVDYFWSPKLGPGGPNLAAKISLARPKMVQSRISVDSVPLAASGVRPGSMNV